MRAPPTTPWVLPLTANLLACSPVVFLEAPPNSLVVVGFEDNERIAVELGRTAIDRLSLDSETRAALWILDLDEFSNPDGSPLGADALGDAGVSIGSNPCGCPNPRFDADAKLISHPGSACPLGRPPDMTYARMDSEVVRVDELPVHVAQQIRVTWPGECECMPTVTSEEPRKLTVCPVLPEGAALSLHQSTIASDGTVAADAGQVLMLFGPNGERFELELLAREVTSYLGALGDRFLLSRWNAEDEDQLSRHRSVGLDGSVVDVTETIGEDFTTQAALKDDSGVWLGGIVPANVANYVTAVMSCESVGGRCRRRVLSQRVGCHWGGRSDGIESFVSARNEIVAISPIGGIASVDPRTTADFECRLESHPAVGSETLRSVRGAESLNGRVFLCAELSNRSAPCGGGRGALVEVDLSSQDARLTLTATRAGSCQSLSRLPNGDLLASFGSRGVLISASGPPTDVALGPAHPGFFGEATESLSNLRISGRWVLSTRNHTILRGPTDGPLEALYGPADGAGNRIGAASTPGQLVVARAGSNVVSLRAAGSTCESIEVAELAPSSDLEADDVVVHLEVDPLDPKRYVVFGTKATGADFVRRGTFGDGSDEAELPFRPIGAARLGADRWAVLGTDSMLVVTIPAFGPIEPATFSAITPEYDDPRTSALERAPDVSTCVQRFRRIDSAQGVAWVTGSRALIRVVDRGQSVRAEGHWFADIDLEVADPMADGLPSPSAVDAECGSDLSLAVELAANPSDLYPHAVFFQLRGRADPCKGGTASLHTLGTLCRLPDERSVFSRVADAVSLVSQTSGLAVINSGGHIVRPPLNQRLTVSQSVHQAAAGFGQTLFLWDGDGTVSVALDRP